VFPLAPGSKLPAIPAAHPPGDIARSACTGQCGRDGHGFHDATTDPAKLDYWWGRYPNSNVGIATGAPGPDVLDIDVREDGSGFAALNRVKRAGLADGQMALIRTPSSGIHMYYRGTDQHNGSIRGQHIDFRSKGGYVVAPPSSTPAGSYVVVQHRPGEVATLDFGKVREVLEPEALKRQRELPAQAQRRPAGRGDEGRVGRLARFVAEGVPGDRNFRVFYAAKQLALSGQLDQGAIESLVGAALRSGLQGGEAEARRSIASGQRDAVCNGAQPTPQVNAEARPTGRDGDRQRPFAPSREPGDEREREAG
jgi:Bifunctional DNA primase/polymerase, N-terminal